jgi:hypothetical protein
MDSAFWMVDKQDVIRLLPVCSLFGRISKNSESNATKELDARESRNKGSNGCQCGLTTILSPFRFMMCEPSICKRPLP